MATATYQRRSPLGLFPDRPVPRLYDRVVEVLRVRHYSRRTVQELLGHKDVKSTMIYTHVLNKGGRGVRSPLEGIRELLREEETARQRGVMPTRRSG